MGADKAVHLLDDGMHGSDVIQTGWALARALGTIEGTELVIAGNESTDGVGGAVPAIIAEYLGLPQLTHLRKLSVDGGKITGERETDDGLFTLEASLPAVVSVTEKINEPRFPSFKGIMAAKKKEVTKLTLAEIGVRGRRGRAGERRGRRCWVPPPSRPSPPVRRSPMRARAAARSLSTWFRRRSSRLNPEIEIR